MTAWMIETRNLTKHFDACTAVDGLDLEIPAGMVFGFLGPNGAGKTTAIRMLMGHLHASSGEARVLGGDPWTLPQRERKRIAYVSENMHLPGWMTPKAALQFNASFYPNWNAQRAEELLKRFDLTNAPRYGVLSKGQKRALCLTLALCANADLLILDEPAAGLDVAARRAFLDAVLEHVYDSERTVFFSSHILSDIERVVDRVAILKKGRLLLSGDLDTLKDSVRRLEFRSEVPRERIASSFNVVRHVLRKDGAEATVTDFSEEKLAALCHALEPEPPPEVRGLNLEDLFVEVVQGEPGDAKGCVA